jgi:hypothetical protein
MPGTVIGQSLNLGYAGKISRNPMNKVNSRFVKSILDGNGDETLNAIHFGYAVVVNTDNTYSKFGQSGTGVSAATAANFGGIAVAEVKQGMVLSFGANTNDGQYDPAQPCDVLQQGSATVYCKEGTPTAGGKVYIMTVAGTHAAVGEFVATDSPAGQGATAVELPNCKWTTGRQDASGIAEMTINYPVQA